MNTRNKRNRNANRNGAPPPPIALPPSGGPFDGLDEDMVRALTQGVDPYTLVGQQQAELAQLRMALNLAINKLKEYKALFDQQDGDDDGPEEGKVPEGAPEGGPTPPEQATA